jgi:hypothetical protein
VFGIHAKKMVTSPYFSDNITPLGLWWWMTSSHISIFIIHLLFFVPLLQVGLYNLLYNNRNVYLMRHWHSFFKCFFQTSIWNRHTTDVHRIPKNAKLLWFPPGVNTVDMRMKFRQLFCCCCCFFGELKQFTVDRECPHKNGFLRCYD